MRSLLITPCHDAALADALLSCAEALVLDLDAELDRDRSRARAAEFLQTARRGAERPRLIVRVGALGSGLIEADLDALGPAAPDAILLPNCRCGADVQNLGVKLAVREALADLPDGVTGILAMAGANALSLFGLASYPGCSRRLQALAWDIEALAADLGARRPSAPPLRLARDQILFAARAAGVLALDTAAPRESLEALRNDAAQARESGFDGKFACDAAQVEILNEIFA